MALVTLDDVVSPGCSVVSVSTCPPSQVQNTNAVEYLAAAHHKTIMGVTPSAFCSILVSTKLIA